MVCFLSGELTWRGKCKILLFYGKSFLTTMDILLLPKKKIVVLTFVFGILLDLLSRLLWRRVRGGLHKSLKLMYNCYTTWKTGKGEIATCWQWISCVDTWTNSWIDRMGKKTWLCGPYRYLQIRNRTRWQIGRQIALIISCFVCGIFYCKMGTVCSFQVNFLERQRVWTSSREICLHSSVRRWVKLWSCWE